MFFKKTNIIRKPIAYASYEKKINIGKLIDTKYQTSGK